MINSTKLSFIEYFICSDTMIKRLDCMKSLLHLFYKHGTASAKSLRNNGLRTQPGQCYSTFFISNILLSVKKWEDGGWCSREEERMGFRKKKKFLRDLITVLQDQAISPFNNFKRVFCSRGFELRQI